MAAVVVPGFGPVIRRPTQCPVQNDEPWVLAYAPSWSEAPPVIPVLTLVESLRPVIRQRDVRIAVLIYELLHRPFLTAEQAATALQTDVPDAVSALEAAEQTVDSEPLVRHYKDVIQLGEAAVNRVERTADSVAGLAQRGILTYRRPGHEAAAEVVRQWLAVHDRITSGDYSALTGTVQSNSSRILGSLVGEILERGEGKGRSAHFVARR